MRRGQYPSIHCLFHFYQISFFRFDRCFSFVFFSNFSTTHEQHMFLKIKSVFCRALSCLVETTLIFALTYIFQTGTGCQRKRCKKENNETNFFATLKCFYRFSYRRQQLCILFLSPCNYNFCRRDTSVL